MTLNGAGTETQQSILDVIDYRDFSPSEVNQAYQDIFSTLLSMDNKVELGIANSVWHSNKYHVQNSLSKIIQEYLTELSKHWISQIRNSPKMLSMTGSNKRPTTGLKIKITIDKSFVFMIREKHTGAILFMGQLIDPTKS